MNRKIAFLLLAAFAFGIFSAGCSGGNEEPKESEGYYKGEMKPKGGGGAATTGP
jgi:hypothetical protein